MHGKGFQGFRVFGLKVSAAGLEKGGEATWSLWLSTGSAGVQFSVEYVNPVNADLLVILLALMVLLSDVSFALPASHLLAIATVVGASKRSLCERAGLRFCSCLLSRIRH